MPSQEISSAARSSEVFGDVETILVHACIREANRASQVSLEVDSLRNSLSESFHGHMRALSDEIRRCSSQLRELADRSQVCYARVPVVLNYLGIMLPCLCRSLRDITAYYEDRGMSREKRWRKMYNQMTDEAGGLPLPQRFMMYNHYLTSLLQLLTRSADFDLNQLEATRAKILKLREQRGIPPPPAEAVKPARPDTLLGDPMQQEKADHWAELIFSHPLTSRTAMNNVRNSKSVGPHLPWGCLDIPPDSRVLFRRTFNNDTLSLIVFTKGLSNAPYIIMRMFHNNAPWFAVHGIHELCLYREGSALELMRWSRTEGRPKVWAVLYHETWEEMVLFYCVFMALKTHNPLTVKVNPDEVKLSGEHRLFQGQIIDDGFRHSLVVYLDVHTRVLRLHVSPLEGAAAHCAVWTAFVTHQASSPTWLVIKSAHRVLLRDIQLYVFSNEYQQQNQRQTKSGAFEIYFVNDKAPSQFRKVFASHKVEGSSKGKSSK